MAAQLALHQHGKSRVRLGRVWRQGDGERPRVPARRRHCHCCRRLWLSIQPAAALPLPSSSLSGPALPFCPPQCTTLWS